VLTAVASASPASTTSSPSAAVVVAVLASLMVSYTRARAEALGRRVQGRARDPACARRDPLRRPRLRARRLARPLHLLAVAVYVLAVLSTFTVLQRIVHVHSELRARNPPLPSTT
jgi:CDP-diacylglycerol--glycerol-3-phosphate 3-phosphatidyltransferase